MDERYTPILSDEERAALRAQRAARRKAAQQARHRRQLRQLLPVGAILLVLVVLLVGWATRRTKTEPEPEAPAAATFTVENSPPEPEPLWAPMEAADTIRLDDTLPSTYAVVIDRSSGKIIAEKNSDTVISPASMTKIMTLLVAVENLKSLDDTAAITIDITDFCFVNDCSVVG